MFNVDNMFSKIFITIVSIGFAMVVLSSFVVFHINYEVTKMSNQNTTILENQARMSVMLNRPAIVFLSN